ncbi:radical SAM superfamily protein [Escherichia coli]|uniref:Radical SAM superfamily protein n=1 Tax=Escherichia coli TaxID=562 RepID=A0A376TSZ7_ECOLX|nr:radical SAM superfamily protein [Escherichia coli]
MSSISLIQPDRDLFSWPQYWGRLFWTGTVFADVS